MTGGIQHLSREQFLDEYWQYRAGQHVTILAPTDWGKSTLAYQLLAHTAHRDLPAISLVMKPKDKTVDQWARALQFRTVHTWPPPMHLRMFKPAGYVLWPKHEFDPERDDWHLYQQFRVAILESYRRGNRILFADEIAGLKDIWLERECNAVWQRGRSMGCGLWAASQRPFNVPLNAYSQSEHLFLGNDPDERSRKRYGEIGGVDPRLVQRATLGLDKYTWLYIRRSGPAMCVVGA